MNKQDISKKLIKLRLHNNWTQDDLATKLNISRQAISKWETGATLPNIDVLLTLSKMYKISINEIVEPRDCNSINDFEEIQMVDANKFKVSLIDMDTRQIVIASMGASPETVDYIETVFSEINFTEERECIGRIQIDKVIKAEEEIIRRVNQSIAQT